MFGLVGGGGVLVGGGGCNWVPQARGLGDNFLANFATPRSLSF